jgi:pyrophosphatase PpaX
VTAWICDVNGVLVDSTVIARDAFAATAGHWRFSFTEQDFAKVKGRWLLEAYRILDPGEDPFARRRFHLQYVRDRIREVRAYPHVAEMLAAAKARGIRVGAATSHGEMAEACLVNTGLYSYIDCLVTQEEVKRPKPHPESILRVLALLDVHPKDSDCGWTVYVGDSAVDIEAGRAAGVRTIGVTYGVSDEAEIRAAGPDHVIRSFRDMDLFLEGPQRQTVLRGARRRAEELSGNVS